MAADKEVSSSVSQDTKKHTVHWFRKGLRLHDNPSLREGLKEATTFRCVFIIDPWFAGSSNVGINKWRFLLQCLEDLDRSLRRLNSRLFVVRGQPADALPKLFREWGTTSLTFEEDPEPYGRVRDHNITAMCKEIGISVVSRVSHTLYKLDSIIEQNGGRAPLTYHQFQTVIASMGAPSTAEATITTDTLGSATTPLSDDHDDKYGVPTLEELGFDTEGLLPPVWVGGESEALARLERHLERKAWVASFGRPKMTPQSLLASQTGLSPYLRFGCLSTRLFYFQLTELYKKIKKSRPPLSLHGQLLWREFFYCAATKNPNFDKMTGNPICVQIPWDKNSDALAKWANGQTGYPWIDAIMIQLREEGWIHHLARHAVACFLTRGDLWISWEDGMKVFEELLLDADWSVNAGTWMWLSCSSFFQQFFHCYCPVRFGRKADPNGDYIRKYIPVLKNIPTRYIHSPWLAPVAVQTAARCTIGKDYPLPIVDHAAASFSNIQRIKQVYHQLSKYRILSNNEDSTKGDNFAQMFAVNNVNRPNVSMSSPSPNTIISSVNHSNYYCSTTPESQNSNQNINNKHDIQNKKQNDDYRNGNRTVNDIFTDNQSRNTTGHQMRNIPYKKIVVMDQNCENSKIESESNNHRLNENYENINNQYSNIYNSIETTNYTEIQRQTGFYVERTNQENSFNKMKSMDTSHIKNNFEYLYNKTTNMDSINHYTEQFKQSTRDVTYEIRKKTYGNLMVKSQNNCQHNNNDNGIDQYENSNNHYHRDEIQEDLYGDRIHREFDNYNPQSFMNGIQSYNHCSRTYNDAVKTNSSYKRSSPQMSLQDGRFTQLNGCRNQREQSECHDCSSEEELCRFQQGKIVMMQGCSRPHNEPE